MSDRAQKSGARRWIVFSIVLLLCVASISLFFEREPTYRGRKLSQWLETIPFEPPHDPPIPAAEAAVRAIGTNAIPFLLHWLTSKDSRLRQALIHFDKSQNIANLDLKPAQTKAQEAMAGFLVLAEIAEPAVIDLVAIAANTNEMASYFAMEILPYLGKAGVEASLQMLSYSNGLSRKAIVYSFAGPAIGGTNSGRYSRFTERYQRDLIIAVPTLIGLLADPDVEVASTAALVLGTSRISPSQAIPALTNICVNPASSERVRQNAVRAIGRYGADARSALPFLIAISNNLDGRTGAIASNSIWRISSAPTK